ncbi:hypothetical protein V8C44DRAFT_333684 [Trichoderma aethiopicum]
MVVYSSVCALETRFPIRIFAFCHSRMAGACHMQTMAFLDWALVHRLEGLIIREPLSDDHSEGLSRLFRFERSVCTCCDYAEPTISMLGHPRLTASCKHVVFSSPGVNSTLQQLPGGPFGDIPAPSATCISGTSKAEYPADNNSCLARALRALKRIPGKRLIVAARHTVLRRLYERVPEPSCMLCRPLALNLEPCFWRGGQKAWEVRLDNQPTLEKRTRPNPKCPSTIMV